MDQDISAASWSAGSVTIHCIVKTIDNIDY